MRVTLPRPGRKNRAVRSLLRAVLIAIVGCGPRQPPAPPPGPPIPADPEVALRDMVVECDGLIAALTEFKRCKHLEEEDQQDLDNWILRAHKDFAAGRKATPEPNAQRAIALACFRATKSVQAASERCAAGPRPKDVTYGR
jgi:hypothetical protein